MLLHRRVQDVTTTLELRNFHNGITLQDAQSVLQNQKPTTPYEAEAF